MWLHAAAQKENRTEHRAVIHKYEETPVVKKGKVGLHTFLEGERCPVSPVKSLRLFFVCTDKQFK